MQKKLPLLITTGEPAGIGMDIVLLLAAEGKLQDFDRPVWVTADATAMQKRADELIAAGILEICPPWKTLNANDATIIEEDFLNQMSQQNINGGTVNDDNAFILFNIPCAAPVVCGKVDTNNSSMVAQQLQIAHKLAINKTVAAIVTGPLQKSALIDADIKLLDGTMFSGHTEFFMQQSGCDKVVMMLANQAMKVALVTTHLALKDIPAAITADNVRQTVQIVIDDMREKFGLTQPRILVCGLNPHAGEGGHLGTEEIEIINPVLQCFINAGIDISEAMPADTLFTPRHLANCDAVIAMYHDQGLPVLKSHGFGDTVNLTLGLPYIRTSVDHGTALDLAGRGGASATSLYQALIMANEMANKSLVN
ncbi:4-hydroxythreonine-4-phosphate dehydrogenase [Psychrobacter arcticus 273-4]|uniref:4-hydroxythreonine-4-phosphate dehydrogenase n=1 Tax=Psychrobacter arcticus (strain DSM 17307 / VKM B-2377 / 273-4) TaxID=259536 RepID=Q4FT45_PSYA2|nr:4-hydroxythreonine-4-phosphate dehydrogenase PdxA [Psychrobacter arcticus]AAZ18813.1 4-hydroxythreonine-4-phosphate dehydrogenase [Psychrobacter arcticus 273-4]